MTSNLLTVKINIREIVGRAEIDEETGVFFSLIVKGFPVPDRAFVEKQLLCLSIPVSRNL